MARAATEARETARKAGEVTEKTGEVVQDIKSKAESTFGVTDKSIPPVYLGLAAGSIALSVFLFAKRSKESAIFVGLWPPTFLTLGLFHKQVMGSRKPAPS